MNARSSKIHSATKIVFENNIEGWVGNQIGDMVRFADALQDTLQIHGDVAEIGIHHGKLFFILSAAMREDEKCYAVDVFDNQILNIDNSGIGNLNQFLSHVENYFPDIKKSLNVINADSISLSSDTGKASLKTSGIRIFSIDGGHTSQHVINDMSIAQDLLVSGGVILLDDYYNPHWTGVSEGFYKFMSHYNKRFAPFMLFQNKLFITTYSEHGIFLDQVRAFIEQEWPNQIHTNWKYVDICGYKCLSSV